MSSPHDNGPFGPISRRSAIGSTLLAGAAFLAPETFAAQGERTPSPPPQAPRKRYEMKKSINLWAFPYPGRMDLRECLQLAKDAGFDGIELNYDLESDLSPNARTEDFHNIRRTAEQVGIAISGLCSFLFWPYPLSSNDPAKRQRGMELAGMMCQAAHDLGRRTCSSSPGPSASPGGRTTSPCATTSASSGPARRWASWCRRRRS